MSNEKEPSQLSENLLFPRIFQSFRIAIQPSKLIIALLAVAIICLAGWLMDLSKTVVATPGLEGQETELQVYMADPGELQSYIEGAVDNSKNTGVFYTLWCFAAERFHGAVYSLFSFDIPGVLENVAACFRALMWAFTYHLIYTIILCIITLAVMSVTGGAICRIAALQFARSEKPGLIEALRFGIRKFASFFTAPLAPLAIIAFIGLFIFILGLIGNIPTFGELMVGIFMLLVLIAGALMSVVLIGAVAGFNLTFPAVAYDNSDCFDAISRSFSYVYAKPWRMGFYTVTAAIYGAICYVFVRFFAFLLLWVSHRSLQFGILGDNKKLATIWPAPTFADLLGLSGSAPGNWAGSVAAFLVYLCLLVVVGLVVSFIISYYFSANTIIYSLMRNKVDNTALDDVYTYSEEARAEPAAPEPEPEETEPEPESETNSQSEPEAKPDSSSSGQ
jgi:hypothetical protein